MRFYVRRGGRDEVEGVVFIAGCSDGSSPRSSTRLWRKFPLPSMKHAVNMNGAIKKSCEYEWRLNGAWCKIHAHASAASAPAEEGSLEQFITEHYWGYSASLKRHSVEYHVAHVPWNVWTSTDARFEGNASALYGLELGKVLRRRPDSAFIADGSPVIVYTGKRIH